MPVAERLVEQRVHGVAGLVDTFSDRTFLITSLMSVVAIVFGTELRFFQRILDTEELTGNQWLICIGAALAVVVVSEVWKLMLRRREAAAEPAEVPVPDDETAPAPV